MQSQDCSSPVRSAIFEWNHLDIKNVVLSFMRVLFGNKFIVLLIPDTYNARKHEGNPSLPLPSLHASLFHSKIATKRIKNRIWQGEMIFDEDSLDTKLTHCSIIFVCYFLLLFMSLCKTFVTSISPFPSVTIFDYFHYCLVSHIMRKKDTSTWYLIKTHFLCVFNINRGNFVKKEDKWGQSFVKRRGRLNIKTQKFISSL